MKQAGDQGRLFLSKLTQKGHLLWMDEILHHLRNPGMMIPLQQTMVSHGFKVVQDFVHSEYGDRPPSDQRSRILLHGVGEELQECPAHSQMGPRHRGDACGVKNKSAGDGGNRPLAWLENSSASHAGESIPAVLIPTEECLDRYIDITSRTKPN